MASRQLVENALVRALISASAMKREMRRKGLEPMRIARLSYAICRTSESYLSEGLESDLISYQYLNGSWNNSIVASMWIASYLSRVAEGSFKVDQFLSFLEEGSGSNSCWGRFEGDMLRIPTTGLVLYLLRENFPNSQVSSRGIYSMWQREFGSLTYKAAFFLLGLSIADFREYSSLVSKTIGWLGENQESSGSFAPWKGHPIGQGNAVWTSQVILALLHAQYNPQSDIVRNAIDWLIKTQLPSGIWPYHEIDEGLAWVIMALQAYLTAVK